MIAFLKINIGCSTQLSHVLGNCSYVAKSTSNKVSEYIDA
jgi:hypothetical protein